MASTDLSVETIPASVPVEERDGGRHVEFSFEIRNRTSDPLELVAIEESVYTAGGALVQLRLVYETGSPILAAPSTAAASAPVRSGRSAIRCRSSRRERRSTSLSIGSFVAARMGAWCRSVFATA